MHKDFCARWYKSNVFLAQPTILTLFLVEEVDKRKPIIAKKGFLYMPVYIFIADDTNATAGDKHSFMANTERKNPSFCIKKKTRPYTRLPLSRAVGQGQ